MLIIVPGSEPERKEPFMQDKPDDYEFMEQCEEVLKDIPDTWKKYPDDCKGKTDILHMEYMEFRNADNPKDKMHELVHVASACLNLWRFLNEQSAS